MITDMSRVRATFATNYHQLRANGKDRLSGGCDGLCRELPRQATSDGGRTAVEDITDPQDKQRTNSKFRKLNKKIRIMKQLKKTLLLLCLMVMAAVEVSGAKKVTINGITYAYYSPSNYKYALVCGLDEFEDEVCTIPSSIKVQGYELEVQGFIYDIDNNNSYPSNSNIKTLICENKFDGTKKYWFGDYYISPGASFGQSSLPNLETIYFRDYMDGSRFYKDKMPKLKDIYSNTNPGNDWAESIYTYGGGIIKQISLHIAGVSDEWLEEHRGNTAFWSEFASIDAFTEDYTETVQVTVAPKLIRGYDNYYDSSDSQTDDHHWKYAAVTERTVEVPKYQDYTIYTWTTYGSYYTLAHVYVNGRDVYDQFVDASDGLGSGMKKYTIKNLSSDAYIKFDVDTTYADIKIICNEGGHIVWTGYNGNRDLRSYSGGGGSDFVRFQKDKSVELKIIPDEGYDLAEYREDGYELMSSKLKGAPVDISLPEDGPIKTYQKTIKADTPQNGLYIFKPYAGTVVPYSSVKGEVTLNVATDASQHRVWATAGAAFPLLETVQSWPARNPTFETLVGRYGATYYDSIGVKQTYMLALIELPSGFDVDKLTVNGKNLIRMEIASANLRLKTIQAGDGGLGEGRFYGITKTANNTLCFIMLPEPDDGASSVFNIGVFKEPEQYIVFADEDEVGFLCLANWDDDGNGRLSHAEAAAAESLGGEFKGIGSETFDELQYFTGLTEIGSQEFYGCSNLKHITLPKTIEKIGVNAFNGCSSLTQLEIPESVKTIEGLAFSNTNIQNLFIPAGVSKIQPDMASGANLQTITVDKDNETYTSGDGDNVIIQREGNVLLTGANRMRIPDTVEEIGPYCALRMTDLKTLTIPESVSTIGIMAFYGCTALTVVQALGIYPPTISERSFGGIDNCKLIVPAGTREKYISAGWTTDIFKGGIEEAAADNGGSEVKVGDVNKDGSITIADVTALVNIILGKTTAQ